MESASIEELFEHFSNKLNLLKSCMELKNVDSSAIYYLGQLDNVVNDTVNIQQKTSRALSNVEQSLQDLTHVKNNIEAVRKVVDFSTEHLPAYFAKEKAPVNDVENIPPSDIKTAKGRPEKVAGAVARPTRSSRIKEIQYLTLDEYQHVPTYMRGRLTYEGINQAIDEFNRTIIEKYKLLETPRSKLRGALLQKVQVYREQETSDTKGLCFCTGEDLKAFSKLKMDKSCFGLLTVLRHCGRTKEIRGPKSLVRYVVVPH